MMIVTFLKEAIQNEKSKQFIVFNDIIAIAIYLNNIYNLKNSSFLQHLF